MDYIDGDSTNGEEKTVIDFIKDLKDVWPFSILFSEKPVPPVVEETIIPVVNDDVDLNNNVTKVIGQNIDLGVDFGLGMLHFVLKYSVNDNVLKVIMFQAKNLVGKDPRGTSDPYAVISFDPRIRMDDYKTTVKMKTLNPIWNHVFAFQNISEDLLSKHKIHITVYDWDKYGSHEPLGEIFYDLRKLCKKVVEVSENDESIEYDDKGRLYRWTEDVVRRYEEGDYAEIDDDDYSSRTTIMITDEDNRIVMDSVSQISVDEDCLDEETEEDEDRKEKESETRIDEIEKDYDEQNQVTTVNVIRRIEIKKNLQALENSRHAYGELLISLDYSIRTRRLVVVIVKATNMIDPSRRSLVPYCTIRHLVIGKDREATKSIHKTSYRFYTANPVWNEEFQLKAAPDKLKSTAIEIQVFDSTKSVKPKDELLGVIRLGLKAYPAQKAHWVEFLSSIGRPVSKWHIIRR